MPISRPPINLSLVHLTPSYCNAKIIFSVWHVDAHCKKSIVEVQPTTPDAEFTIIQNRGKRYKGCINNVQDAYDYKHLFGVLTTIMKFNSICTNVGDCNFNQ